jgi:chromosome segregation ATPase
MDDLDMEDHGHLYNEYVDTVKKLNEQVAALTAELETERKLFALKQNDWIDTCKENDKLTATLAEQKEKIERLWEQYNDLLYQVEKKYPDESRHETAKRFIRAYQHIDYGPKQDALKEVK